MANRITKAQLVKMLEAERERNSILQANIDRLEKEKI